MPQFMKKTASLLAIAVVSLSISSCREEEQGRLLNYEKGTYLGKSDTSLNSEQLGQLTSRSRLQSNY